jgi:hypothetical protein
VCREQDVKKCHCKGFYTFHPHTICNITWFLAVLALLGMIHDCVNINLNLHTSTTVVKFCNALASSTADALCGELSNRGINFRSRR